MPYELSRRLGAGPLLCDGAMGTLLYARGVSLDACFDVLNLNNPRVVQSIHADYIAAGADCIETNTFGANRFRSEEHTSELQSHVNLVCRLLLEKKKKKKKITINNTKIKKRKTTN